MAGMGKAVGDVGKAVGGVGKAVGGMGKAVGGMGKDFVGGLGNLFKTKQRHWRLRKCDLLISRFKETNQEFLNPFIKNVECLFHYQKIMQKFKTLPFQEKSDFFNQASELINKLKKKIFYENNFDEVEKLLPLLHMLTYILTYYGLVEHKLQLDNLAQ